MRSLLLLISRSAGGDRSSAGFDLAVAGGLTILLQLEVWFQTGEDALFTHKPWSSVLLLGATVPLFWRRRAPLAVAALWGFATAGQTAMTGVFASSAGLLLGALVVLYSVAAYGDRLTAFAGLAVMAIAIGIREAYDFPRPPTDNWQATVFYLLPLLAFAAGLYVRSTRESAHHERRARRLERDRDERALAAAEERVRIARELHDVVAHSVTATVVQAEAAEEVLSRSPDSARQALRNIQQTGREALITMRGLVGIMRSHESPGALTPQAGVAELPMLVEDSKASDLRISLCVEGEPRQLSPGVDLSAYRIVQESLTNVRQHAGRPATALVTVRYEELWIELEVLDDGHARQPSDSGGHGLIGIRERVAFFGGEVTAGPRAGAGFVVRARLPVTPVQP